jgi:3-methyl-2-oxobutanoate hydroxymethyltransferase
MSDEARAVSLTDIAEAKQRGERLVMVTAYDAPSGRFADEAGVDLVLVGDSAANNVLGYPTTVPVTMDELAMLTAAVCRTVRRALVVADLPFGAYQASDRDAVRNAVRFVKEAGASAVKLEGAGPMLSRVRAMVGAGIPVMGHTGLTPQSATMLGGLKAQGRTAAKARRVYADAVELQEAGCFSVVLEAVPSRVAARITGDLRVPTIGIGAGDGCDGQVLVWHDLLGINQGRLPKFVRRFADVAGETRRGLAAYVAAVRSGTYPAEEHAYTISDAELELFESELGEGVRVK